VFEISSQSQPVGSCGKVGIPDHILLKPGKLTPEEFEIMKTHTVIGAKTLMDVSQRFPNNQFIRMGSRSLSLIMNDGMAKATRKAWLAIIFP